MLPLRIYFLNSKDVSNTPNSLCWSGFVAMVRSKELGWEMKHWKYLEVSGSAARHWDPWDPVTAVLGSTGVPGPWIQGTSPCLQRIKERGALGCRARLMPWRL